MRIPHAAALDAYPLSVAVWFKTTTTGTRGLVTKYVAGSYNGYQMFFSNGSLCAWYMKDAANYVYDVTNCTMNTATSVATAAGLRPLTDQQDRGRRTGDGGKTRTGSCSRRAVR